MPVMVTIKLIHLRTDLGLYETWDYMIVKHAAADFLQNWNVDDRKHSAALRMKVNTLINQPAASLVSSAVFVTRTPNQGWLATRDGFDSEVWFGNLDGYYGLFSIFQHTEHSVNSLNYPHNSPMYRRTLHEKYGKFSSNWQRSPLDLHKAPTCTDFHFWTRALKLARHSIITGHRLRYITCAKIAQVEETARRLEWNARNKWSLTHCLLRRVT